MGKNTKKILFYLVLAAVLVAVGVRFFSGGKSGAVKNYPSAGTDVIAFGDSLVFGTGASGEDKNFVALLSAKAGVPIFNLGVPGNTTEDALARLPDLDKYSLKIVLLLLGGNDRLRSVPDEQTISNLGKIIENIQSRGAVVILLGVKGNLLGDKFGAELEKISRKHETAYVPDVLGGLFGNAKYMSDALHPNDAGYAKIADRVYPVLLRYLK